MDPLRTLVARLRRQGPRAPRQRLVVRQDHPAASGGDDLVAVERETAHGAVRAHAAPLVRGAQRLGRVLHEGEREPRGELEEGIEIRRVAVEVDREQRPYATPGR